MSSAVTALVLATVFTCLVGSDRVHSLHFPHTQQLSVVGKFGQHSDVAHSTLRSSKVREGRLATLALSFSAFGMPMKYYRKTPAQQNFPNTVQSYRFYNIRQHTRLRSPLIPTS